jgi:hypothetical protein
MHGQDAGRPRRVATLGAKGGGHLRGDRRPRRAPADQERRDERARPAALAPVPGDVVRLTLHVGGLLVDGPGPAPARIRLVRSDDLWTSAAVELDAEGAFVATIDLLPRRPNVFRIAPLSRTLGVALADDTVRVYFGRGAPLPARRTFLYHTVESVAARCGARRARSRALRGDDQGQDGRPRRRLGRPGRAHRGERRRGSPERTWRARRRPKARTAPSGRARRTGETCSSGATKGPGWRACATAAGGSGSRSCLRGRQATRKLVSTKTRFKQRRSRGGSSRRRRERSPRRRRRAAPARLPSPWGRRPSSAWRGARSSGRHGHRAILRSRDRAWRLGDAAEDLPRQSGR